MDIKLVVKFILVSIQCGVETLTHMNIIEMEMRTEETTRNVFVCIFACLSVWYEVKKLNKMEIVQFSLQFLT